MDRKLYDLRSFNSICRACMKNDSLTSIFLPSKKCSLKLSEMLRYCTEVEVNEGDNLPSLICKQCISILVLLYEFKCNVRNSDAIFKQIITNTNSNDNADLEISNNPILSTSVECNNIKLESTNEVLHYVNDLCAESTNLDEAPKTETRLDKEETCTNKISKTRCDIPKSTKRKVKRVDTTQCEVCGKIFTCRSKLIQHMRKHTGEKPFSCDLCEKKFARAEHVAIHRRIHTGERPYTCTVCQKTFVQYAALTAHLRIHSGERPYMCTICGKSFSQSVSLVYHTRTHTGETPFKCKICNKGFTHSGNLKIHMRFHRNERPFVCNVCGRRFVTSSHLTVHIKKHTGDRPYKCNLCGKAFARSQHLKDHLVSHSGQKPYACKLCPKRYTQSGHLTRHMKTHRT